MQLSSHIKAKLVLIFKWCLNRTIFIYTQIQQKNLLLRGVVLRHPVLPMLEKTLRIQVKKLCGCSTKCMTLELEFQVWILSPFFLLYSCQFLKKNMTVYCVSAHLQKRQFQLCLKGTCKQVPIMHESTVVLDWDLLFANNW
jgi:hypothetical protein